MSAIGIEQIYAGVFRTLRPRAILQEVRVDFRPYANANSFIEWRDGKLMVRISDLLLQAPRDVQEALAWILLGKLFRKPVPAAHRHRYRQYLNRKEIVRRAEALKRERGRKQVKQAQGKVYDLVQLFEDLNFRYFYGLMARPELGWSARVSQSTLGHYDPAHHMIVLSSWLDRPEVPQVVVEYVLYHEMLHLRHPIERRGGRRRIHSPEFQQAERAFAGYHEAVAWLKHACGQAACLSARPTRSGGGGVGRVRHKR